MAIRQLSQLDQLISGLNQALNVIGGNSTAKRPYPASATDTSLSDSDKRIASGYMRVNHVGEVCAQALYQSQALTARSNETRYKMRIAAQEEIDHLAWCELRLKELNSRTSYLNPAWYCGAFAIGTIAGIAGDKWNLGFLEETEHQVVKHLESHLANLPVADIRSRQIVKQMREDENKHAEMAHHAGAAPLPKLVKHLMQTTSSIMTKTAYYI